MISKLRSVMQYFNENVSEEESHDQTTLGTWCNMYPYEPFTVHVHLEKILKVYRKENCIFKPTRPHLFLCIAKFFSCVIMNIEPKTRVSEYH